MDHLAVEVLHEFQKCFNRLPHTARSGFHPNRRTCRVTWSSLDSKSSFTASTYSTEGSLTQHGNVGNKVKTPLVTNTPRLCRIARFASQKIHKKTRIPPDPRSISLDSSRRPCAHCPPSCWFSGGSSGAFRSSRSFRSCFCDMSKPPKRMHTLIHLSCEMYVTWTWHVRDMWTYVDMTFCDMLYGVGEWPKFQCMEEVLPYWYRMLERVPKEEMLLSANLVETRGNLPPLVWNYVLLMVACPVLHVQTTVFFGEFPDRRMHDCLQLDWIDAQFRCFLGIPFVSKQSCGRQPSPWLLGAVSLSACMILEHLYYIHISYIYTYDWIYIYTYKYIYIHTYT